MNLKDGFNGKAVKESYHKRRKEVMKYTAEITDKFRPLIDDFRIEQLSKLSQNAKIGIGAGLLGVAVISIALFLNISNDVHKVIIAGQEVGYITEEEMVDKTLEEIKVDVSNKASGMEIVVDSDALVCEATALKAKDVTILTKDKLKEKILAAELFKVKAWAINIKGSNVVAASTEEGANSILEGVRSYYQTDGAELVSATFKEDVVVTQAAVNVANVMKPEDAVTLIVTGTKEPKIYTVKDGDTLWDIAIANGMSPAELESANTGFDPEKLKIGQQLNLYQMKPYVTVQIKEVVATTENINFKTVYENINTLYKGQIKVKTAGVYGTKEIKTEVTKENDVVIATKELDSVVVSEPQDQVTLKGTKSLATFAGSGSLSSPLNRIDISSAFGVNRGSRRHAGVDLRNPKGTPIKAADDGVVTFAAYSGTYGNIVKLSHGNGIETWYAHANTIGVSVGQVVKKGDVIATVGMTGRTTGYHLHLEVRKNGVPQNPMNYL